MKKIELFISILNEIVERVRHECDLIDAGKVSKWDKDQLENIVLPEMNELLTYALKGKVFLSTERSNAYLNHHI